MFVYIVNKHTLKNGKPNSPATARASDVLPHPLGPYAMMHVNKGERENQGEEDTSPEAINLWMVSHRYAHTSEEI
jgi:hypothetical protein